MNLKTNIRRIHRKFIYWDNHNGTQDYKITISVFSLLVFIYKPNGIKTVGDRFLKTIFSGLFEQIK